MQKALSTFLSLLVLFSVTESLQAASTPASPAMQASTGYHPYFKTALYPAWSQMTPSQALLDFEAAKKEALSNLNAIAAIRPEEATFENTFLAYTQATSNMNQLFAYMEHLVNTADTPERFKLRSKLAKAYANHRQNLNMYPKIFQVLSKAAQADWVKKLDAPRKNLISKVMIDLKNTGVTLTPEQRARKSAIEYELQQLCYKFSANLPASKAWRIVITDPTKLEGMPDYWMKKSAAEAKGLGYGSAENPCYVVNLTTCPADAVLYNCTVEETRRLCWLGMNSAGTALAIDNEPIIYRIMELRHELANLLGYKNHADKRASSRMLDSGEKALAFVNDMLAKSKPAWDAYVQDKLKRFSHAAGRELKVLHPWNEKFILAHRVNPPLPSQKPSFSSQAYAPYLQFENVLQGMLNVWSKLLGVSYEEIPTVCLKCGEPCPSGHVEAWAPGVRCFKVSDSTTGQHLGSFFLDLFPRKGKRTDLSWCFPLRIGAPGEPHLAVMVTNFPAPRKGEPHLLQHDQLYMLYHEFGHIMHMCLAHGGLTPLNAPGVESDFIETPSHLQESWVWEPELLASFAKHYATGEPIPQKLLVDLRLSRENAPILPHINMLIMAKLDLELHLYYHEKFKGRSLDKVSTELCKPWIFPGAETTPSPYRTLTHCISAGYDAGFYTYKWSEVMASDAFSRFKKEGIFNPSTGADYRRCLLTPGCSKPATDLFRDFMGRDPNPSALLKRYKVK